jgi:hypothetical protein
MSFCLPKNDIQVTNKAISEMHFIADAAKKFRTRVKKLEQRLSHRQTDQKRAISGNAGNFFS